MSINNKSLPAMLDRIGLLECSRAISDSKLASYFLHLFRIVLVWYTVGIYYSVISAFIEPHCHHKASVHLSISTLINHFSTCNTPTD